MPVAISILQDCVKDYCQEHNLSYNDFAKIIGQTNVSFSRFMGVSGGKGSPAYKAVSNFFGKKDARKSSKRTLEALAAAAPVADILSETLLANKKIKVPPSEFASVSASSSSSSNEVSTVPAAADAADAAASADVSAAASTNDPSDVAAPVNATLLANVAAAVSLNVQPEVLVVGDTDKTARAEDISEDARLLAEVAVAVSSGMPTDVTVAASTNVPPEGTVAAGEDEK